MLKKYLWKKAIKKACSATEGLENTFANYLTKSPGVKRYFRLLTKANTSNNLYRNFVITIAFELYMCKRKEQKAWSLAFAILDNWFDLNKVDYQEIQNQVDPKELKNILSGTQNVYREYFLLYDDPIGKDLIRVHFPYPFGKLYVDVKANLSRGIESGFCEGVREAFSKQDQEKEKEWSLILRLPKEVIDFCDKFNTGQGNMYDTPIDFRKFSSGYLDGKCFGEQKRLQPARHASTI